MNTEPIKNIRGLYECTPELLTEALRRSEADFEKRSADEFMQEQIALYRERQKQSPTVSRAVKEVPLVKTAFTLVELLVVITIIGILSSLITAGVMGAMRSAKQARIKMVMGQVELALEQYKNKYGEYPPDWSDPTAVMRHVRKRWPRFYDSLPDDKYTSFCNCIATSTGWDVPGDFAYAGSLPFWLGGLPNNAQGAKIDGTTVTAVGYSDPRPAFTSLNGFSSNPDNPFEVIKDGKRVSSLEPPMIELEVGKNLALFTADGTDGTTDGNHGKCVLIFTDKGPIVYFKAIASQETAAYGVPGTNIKSLWNNVQHTGNPTFAYCFSRDTTNFTQFFPGSATPYLQNTNAFFNPKSYQLVHPGLDGKFGGWQDGGAYGSTDTDAKGRIARLSDGEGVGQYDLDNIVNFGDGATLKSLLP